ncbi:hypothetical protein KKE26_11950 [bacterium]|nr:hypothetical protein [bacterium]
MVVGLVGKDKCIHRGKLQQEFPFCAFVMNTSIMFQKFEHRVIMIS